jgi:hypothetical protein
MHTSDRLRRGFYTIAFAISLVAVFVLLSGAFWSGAALLGAAMATVALAEHIAATPRRLEARPLPR